MEIYDSYDDVSGFAGRYEGAQLKAYLVYKILQSLTCVFFVGTVGMNYLKTFLAQVRFCHIIIFIVFRLT